MDCLQVLDRAEAMDCRDLLRIGLDATLGDDKPKEHSLWDPEDALLGVEFDPVVV